jgi:hypothetical protein
LTNECVWDRLGAAAYRDNEGLGTISLDVTSVPATWLWTKVVRTLSHACLVCWFGGFDGPVIQLSSIDGNKVAIPLRPSNVPQYCTRIEALPY